MNTQYQKYVDGQVVSRFNVSADDVSEVDQYLSLKNVLITKTHGNSRQVAVVGSVDESVYTERIEKKGAKPILERLFESAKAASRHLGYQWDAVTQALMRAKERGEDIAIVAGVPFQWADKMPGAD